MVTGNFDLNLDAKGRLAIPTKHRDELISQCGGRMKVTISPSDRCLVLYPLDEWAVVEKKLMGLSNMHQQNRRMQRMLLGHADDCSMDGSGRVLLPAPLREFARMDKKVSLIGQGHRYEIWDYESWIAHRDALFEDVIDESDLSADLETFSY